MGVVIEIRKISGKPSVIKITRPDGSHSWSKVHPGLEYHDLAHFAVESTLNLRHAFFGMIMDGHDIGDFELPRDQRPDAVMPAQLPIESLQTEYIVNQLQSEQGMDTPSEAFMDTLRQALDEKGLPFPKGLDVFSLVEIRKEYYRLVASWQSLTPGESLRLEFTVRES